MLFNIMSKDMLLSYFLVVMLLSYSNKNKIIIYLIISAESWNYMYLVIKDMSGKLHN